MKKFYINAAFAAGVAAAALPAMALLPANPNALSKPPVMDGCFKVPETGSLSDKGKTDIKESTAETGTPRAVAKAAKVTKALDGTPLPRIIASVYDYTTNTIGMYRLPEVAGGEMEKVADISSYYGGAMHNGIYYACHDGRYEEYWDTDNDPHGHKIQAYDINTWEPVGTEKYFADYRSSDMAIHPVTGKAYAFCDYGSMMYHLYQLDLQAGTETDLSGNLTIMPEESSRALAFNDEGVLYGVTRAGKFGIVDLTNGKNSSTYDLGLEGSSQFGWTADFDPDTQQFIFIFNGNNATTGYNNKSIIYSIDPATGTMTELAQFTDKCITSMFIAADPVADGAPGAVTGVAGSFPGGALTGTVAFTMPSALHDGTPASGTADWTVADGDAIVASGTAAYGTNVSAPVTVTAGGKHNFVIRASNSAGEGKKERLSMWVGPDVPKAPESVTVDYNEDESLFTVSWTAVTEGANGGYVDPQAIRYTVTRNPGGVSVAENVAGLATTHTYAPAGIEHVAFEVRASQGEQLSEAAVSDPVVTGTLALPYDMTATEGSYTENWTILDANNDGRTWEYSYHTIKYTYHSSNSADDWLISPPIKGYAGCKHKVRLSVYAHGWSAPSNFPEKIEVKTGTTPTAAGMTKTVVAPTVVDAISDAPQIIEFDIEPDQDGKFFLGLHAISDPDQYYLYINGLTITAPVSSEAPGAVTDLALAADPSGALKVTGSGKAPLQTSNGHTLPSITKIDVMRDGVTVATVNNPVPGAEFTFTDENIPEEGLKNYTAVAYAGEMAGDVCDPVQVYAGINYPGEITGLTIAEGSVPGEITVNWDALEVDRDGFPLKGDVTYALEVYPDNAYYHGNKTYEDIEGTSYTFTPMFDNGRDYGFVYVKVWARNSKGSGYFAKSVNIPVGTPCAMPFGESFPDYSLEHPWGDGASNGPQIASITDDERALSFQQFNGWNRMMDRSFNADYGAQDGDNGFAGMFGWSYVEDEAGNYHNEWNELISPKLSLAGDAKPVLTFYTFNWLNENGKDMNELAVDVVADGVRRNVRDIVIGDLGNTQAWEFVAVDLSEYAGKTVYLIFKGTIKAHGDNGYNWILLDNIDISSVAGTDIAVDGLVVPVQAAPGEEFTVKARVTNLGASAVNAPRAILTKNGEKVAEKDLEPLPFSSSTEVEFTHILSVNDPVGNVMQVSVEAEGDENPDNNITAPATVGRNLQLLPEPRNVRLADGNTLEWDNPDMAAALPAPFTDDFESYGDTEYSGLFTTEAGDWVFVDVDQAPIGGIVSSSTFEIIEFPGIPNHSKQSWWVQSRLFEEFNNDYFGYSGLQYLANMYVVNDAFNKAVQQDDWAISPLLCGKEQMISLMARSYDRYTPETIELLWSDGSLNPADFTLVRRIERMSGDWTQYIFVVPEGARRFAIRGCSFAEGGTNQTFVDDVTFVPATGAPLDLELLGFNIYSGNTRLNSAPAKDLSLALENYDADNVYSVSAVYDKGESRAVRLGETALGSISAAGVKVSAAPGLIIIDGLDNDTYTVVNPAGITVASANASGRATVAVTPGVYLVKVGATAVKTVVR